MHFADNLKSILLAAFVGGAHLLGASQACAQTVDDPDFGRLDFNVQGFAALPGVAGTHWYQAAGTTGGEGGQVVVAETFTQLQAYCQSSKPYVILVTNDITTGVVAYVDALASGVLCDKQDGSQGVPTTYGERILVASNKTIVGVGNPLISRITFVVQCQSNIIMRNLRFTMNGVPVLKAGENKVVAWRQGAPVQVGDPDIIGIQADANSAKTDFGSHIWVDHCEFFNGNASNKDRYDGLLDCKNNVQWLTFSYNFFHDHDKSCLFGKGDSDIFPGCRTISFHHNLMRNIEGSRLPLQRGGQLHYANNVQDGCSDGWDLRSQSEGYVEACYFHNTKAPIRLRGTETKGLNIRHDEGYDIVYDGCARRIEGYDDISSSKTDELYTLIPSSWNPYALEGYALQVHPTAQVAALLERYAGSGKVDIWKHYAAQIPAVDAQSLREAVSTALTGSSYDANGEKVTPETIAPAQPENPSDPETPSEPETPSAINNVRSDAGVVSSQIFSLGGANVTDRAGANAGGLRTTGNRKIGVRRTVYSDGSVRSKLCVY